mmetsp:Transcript_69642/g.215309  ORF Transcript_69642/g.215309 Transcript_69642/m.215309 type:complete len:269 (+) Transcript_69642:134-940(+)
MDPLTEWRAALEMFHLLIAPVEAVVRLLAQRIDDEDGAPIPPPADMNPRVQARPRDTAETNAVLLRHLDVRLALARLEWMECLAARSACVHPPIVVADERPRHGGPALERPIERLDGADVEVAIHVQIFCRPHAALAAQGGCQGLVVEPLDPPDPRRSAKLALQLVLGILGRPVHPDLPLLLLHVRLGLGQPRKAVKAPEARIGAKLLPQQQHARPPVDTELVHVALARHESLVDGVATRLLHGRIPPTQHVAGCHGCPEGGRQGREG